ncbi:pyruvate kinase [Massilia putida]|uniref:pyruvate kinase n=1 Tax=Massilia putida TaxID=1141883 RepID=UPI0009521861|nr:pyruvate kinase [Massilia putida]
MADDDIERAGSGEAVAVLLRELESIRADIVAETLHAQHRIAEVQPHYQASARNLLHYLALRRRDLRPLQQRLATLGLSSLGRAEAHVLATVDAVLSLLRRLMHSAEPVPESDHYIEFSAGSRILDEHADQLLGPRPNGRNVRIMVTMPSTAADDAELVHQLLEQGMGCIRINCAYDDTATWSRIIDNLRRAEKALGRTCKVAMDLAGPKLRTGPVEPGPQVLRIRPERDVLGRVVAPARLWIAANVDARKAPADADACVDVPEKWLAGLHKDDHVTLTDARGARRFLIVAEVTDMGCWLESDKTVYIVPETILRHRRKGHKGKAKTARVGALPSTEQVIRLRDGDVLMLTRELIPGRPASVDSMGQCSVPARIGCTLPAVFDDVRAGETIWFDDGKIGGIIEKVEKDAMVVRIKCARPGGEKLRADKGINLPDSELKLAALTSKDIDDLPFIAEHADIVELSFANRASDVEELQNHLAKLGDRQPAIVLKIETRRGFENLPDMLLTAMHSSSCGVMIARGDLAVETGFERLAEIQEEILWISEASHVPVIWATQVLESLAKEGRPSRAEITDAAMSDRAECVMLNKGPHIVAALRTLDDILKRMQAHQAKKQAMLRDLALAHRQQSA